MVKLTCLHENLLKEYSRPIVHLRRQIDAKRFGLVFGAGISKPFGIPTWEQLVDLLADDPAIQGRSVLEAVATRAGMPYRTEMLFEHYRHLRYQAANSEKHHTRELDLWIGSDWLAIIRNHLYANFSNDFEAALKNHPYLMTYLPLIQAAYMTVTYNFDTLIERALWSNKADKDIRGFETVTNPWTQFRRTAGTIYHPNGVVDQNVLEGSSDRLVFSEASYAEQLMGIYAGDEAGLVNHLSKHTCLFIGLSLDDEVLRNVLTQAARACPGNFHYYVHFLKDNENLDQDQKHAIRCTNFKVYNLITLFLRNEEIRIFGELINPNLCPSEELREFGSVKGIPMSYRFYIVGPLGVGKSTTINHFRNLTVYDEWVDERPEILRKDWEELQPQEKDDADAWVIDQFEKKNAKLRRETEGIFILDRGPLDPLAFTAENEWAEKASRILNKLCPNPDVWKVENGRVVFLSGDSSELALRIIRQQKRYTDEKLTKMAARLKQAYGTTGVMEIDTRGLPSTDVARRVAEIVHLEDYTPVCNLHNRLEGFQKGVAHVST
jgi:hypothetical protein